MRGFLAESPRDFRHFRKHVSFSPSYTTGKAEPRDNLIRVRAVDSKSLRKPLYVNSKGFQMVCGVQDLRLWAKGEILLFFLNCCFDGNPMRVAGTYLPSAGRHGPLCSHQGARDCGCHPRRPPYQDGHHPGNSHDRGASRIPPRRAVDSFVYQSA